MKLDERCYNFALAHYKLIPQDKLVKADFALSNRACHFNAVAAYNAGRADKVWLVWGGGKSGVIHFINSKNGKFFDETWHDYTNQKYRIIREIHQGEFNDIYDILCATKISLIQALGSPWQKIKSKLRGSYPHGDI